MGCCCSSSEFEERFINIENGKPDDELEPLDDVQFENVAIGSSDSKESISILHFEDSVPQVKIPIEVIEIKPKMQPLKEEKIILSESGIHIFHGKVLNRVETKSKKFTTIEITSAAYAYALPFDLCVRVCN